MSLRREDSLYFRIWIKNQIRYLTKDSEFNSNFCIEAPALMDENKDLIIYILEKIIKTKKENENTLISPFIIDPVIPRIYNSSTESSRAIRILYNKFKIDELKKQIENRKFSKTLIEEFTTKVINFQNLKRKNPNLMDVVFDLEEFNPPQLTPKFYIPPYFSFRETQNGDLNLAYDYNKYSLEFAKKIKPKSKHYIVLCSTLRILERHIDDFIGDFKTADGFIIWVENFNGEDSNNKIKNMQKKEFETELSKHKNVISAYGSSFDFSNHNLSGIILKTNSMPVGYSRSGRPYKTGAPKDCYLEKKQIMGTFNDFKSSFMYRNCNCNTCNKKFTYIRSQYPNKSNRFHKQIFLSEFKNSEQLKIQHFRDTKTKEYLEL